MSAFLRSLDWGCVPQFGKPKIEIEGEITDILSYKLQKKSVLIETQKGKINFD